jgi:hypothetical protein
MTCENCRFWEETKKTVPANGVRMGYCRRNPPIATGCFVPKPGRIAGSITPQLVEMTLWPQVSASNWCGESEARILTNDRNRKTPKETKEV